jgi:hypothetical protein
MPVFKQWGAINAKILVADAADPQFEIPKAQVYFIYDLSVLPVIKTAIERSEPRLSQVVRPEHFTNFTIYRSRE